MNMNGDTQNTIFLPIVMSSNEMDVQPQTIDVNPHNTDYVEDAGPLVRHMSIIDKLSLSLKFNMTDFCMDLHETAAGTFLGAGIQTIRFLWRPIFGSFDQKLNATDDDTGVTVAAMLGLTVDSTFEDVVPITTNKLHVAGDSDASLPVSTVNAVQVFGDFNMTSNLTMEDHVWDEDLFQAMLRRSTVKGALRSMVGRTRHVTLTRQFPNKTFYLDKFVPRAIRRIVPFSFLGIQVHIPNSAHVSQAYSHTSIPAGAHLGVKAIANYHEWHADHEQALAATA